MERRNVIPRIMGFDPIVALYKYFHENLEAATGLEQVVGIVKLLALAWVAGAHTALVSPGSVAGELVGSEEIHRIVADTWRKVFADAGPELLEELVRSAMARELSLPTTPLTLEDFTFYPN